MSKVKSKYCNIPIHTDEIWQRILTSNYIDKMLAEIITPKLIVAGKGWKEVQNPKEFIYNDISGKTTFRGIEVNYNILFLSAVGLSEDYSLGAVKNGESRYLEFSY